MTAVDDPVAAYLRKTRRLAAGSRILVLVILAAGATIAGYHWFQYAQATQAVRSAESSLAAAHTELNDAQDELDSATVSKGAAWTIVQSAIADGARSYDAAVATGVANGTVPAPVWPATFGFDSALFADYQAAQAEIQKPYSAAVDRAEAAEAAVGETDTQKTVSEVSLSTMQGLSNEKRTVAVWASVITAIFILLSATIALVLSLSASKASATVALAQPKS